MPPRAKFTKQEIINAALGILRKSGTEALTARELGTVLGSSARPVFTVFESMNDVLAESMKAARNIYNEYIAKGLIETPAFKAVGMKYIQFAIDEPKLFQILFMTEAETTPELTEVLAAIDDNYLEIVKSIASMYQLDSDNAWKLYRHLWVYTHGIAVLCATKVCRFTQDEISEMLTEVFSSILIRMKTGDRA